MIIYNIYESINKSQKLQLIRNEKDRQNLQTNLYKECVHVNNNEFMGPETRNKYVLKGAFTHVMGVTAQKKGEGGPHKVSADRVQEGKTKKSMSSSKTNLYGKKGGGGTINSSDGSKKVYTTQKKFTQLVDSQNKTETEQKMQNSNTVVIINVNPKRKYVRERKGQGREHNTVKKNNTQKKTK